METVDVLIKCPRQIQINIEEYCINQGIDFTRYFLDLHYEKIGKEVSKEFLKGDETKEEEEKPQSKNNQKGKKK